MSINPHQFEQLSEMGISLWQQRSRQSDIDINSSSTNPYLNIDLKTLIEEQLFNDIISAAGLTIGEVQQQGDHLNLGLFNWYFIPPKEQASPDENKNTIKWLDHQLFTPPLKSIAQSPALKRQLWQLLGSKTQ